MFKNDLAVEAWWCGECSVTDSSGNVSTAN